MNVQFSNDVVQSRLVKAVDYLVKRYGLIRDEVMESISLHLLIYYAKFDTAKNSVVWSLEPGTKVSDDEIRLDQQDGFVMSRWGRAVRRCTPNTAGNNYSSNEPYFPAIEPCYFNGTTSSVREYKSLLPYFHGKMDLKQTGKAPMLSDASGLLTYVQPLGSYTPLASTAVPEEYSEFSLNTALRNVYNPQLLLGSENYEATVNFTNGVYSAIKGGFDSDGTTARTTENVAVLFMEGFRIQGLAARKLIVDKG